jgi:late competence protein required for DNA uptake (superfamily II DNA/RNA helicase)
MEKELIVAFAFGKPRLLVPNLVIGVICKEKSEEILKQGKDVVIFTQYDVPIFNENFEVIRPDEIMNQPPSTYLLAEKAIEWAEKNEIKKIWIVAAEPHLLRATRDITYIAEQRQQKINFRICNKEIKSYKNCWFRRNSKQWWTQNKYKWWLREFILLLIPIFFYKKMQR